MDKVFLFRIFMTLQLFRTPWTFCVWIYLYHTRYYVHIDTVLKIVSNLFLKSILQKITPPTKHCPRKIISINILTERRQDKQTDTCHMCTSRVTGIT